VKVCWVVVVGGYQGEVKMCWVVVVGGCQVEVKVVLLCWTVSTPELLYQPSMVGVDQAGIAETIEFMLTKFSDDEQRRLCQVSWASSTVFLIWCDSVS